jgi:hypothetical protein
MSFAFHISAIRDFVFPVVKCFDTPTPGIQNSEMESDQWSGISAFGFSVFRHFCDEVFRHFQPPVSRTLKWSQINGPVFQHFTFLMYLHFLVFRHSNVPCLTRIFWRFTFQYFLFIFRILAFRFFTFRHFASWNAIAFPSFYF